MKSHVAQKLSVILALILTFILLTQIAYSITWVFPHFLVEGEGELNPQYGPYYEGQHLMMIAVAYDGYFFDYWKRNGTIVENTTNPWTITYLGVGENFTAVFTAYNGTWLDPTFLAIGPGRIVPTGEYELGADIVVTAVPDYPYYFVCFERNAVIKNYLGSATYIVVNLQSGETLTAIFSYSDPGLRAVDLAVTPPLEVNLFLSLFISLGLGCVGFGMSKGKDPMTALFLMFVGLFVCYVIGWVPPWVLISSVALLGIILAAKLKGVFGGK